MVRTTKRTSPTCIIVSGSIVEALEHLKSKAEAVFAEVRQTKTTAQQNFKLLEQSWADAEDREASQKFSAETEARLTADTANVKPPDNSLAKDTRDCLLKASELDVATNDRSQSWTSLATATNVISRPGSSLADDAEADALAIIVEKNESMMQVPQRSSARQANVIMAITSKLEAQKLWTANVPLLSSLRALISLPTSTLSLGPSPPWTRVHLGKTSGRTLEDDITQWSCGYSHVFFFDYFVGGGLLPFPFASNSH